MKLLNLIILASILALFGSCCPKIVSVSNNTTTTKDSSTTLIPKDSTIDVPAKVVHIYHSVNCDSLGKAQMKKQVVKKDGMTGTAEIKDGELAVSCNADALKLKIKWWEKQYRVLEKTKTTQINNIEVYKLRWWQEAGLWAFLVLLIIDLWMLRKRINW